ncbi:hypothetical protein PPYR_11733 [Photinus pyralis]|uniref:Major facilitator superfamily (MFS) profile domain-containing protein n=1 Tax=Photinus pyralis TaxID=7054 RepID=A0A5N4AC51_PHOPY|nr:facilitated trehalose transporter Tret1-like [Photinus pyralis]KAB0794894.1 hypothetical protein PPYR_11733 [Photinus pyralis]
MKIFILLQMSVRYGALDTTYIYDDDSDDYEFEEELYQHARTVEDSQKVHEKTWWDVALESFLVIYLLITAANNGMIMGYSAVLLPQLKAVNGSLQIDDEMGSWMASINSASIPIGALFSGILMNYFGRKGALLIYVGTVTVGWVFILIAESHTLVLIGRFFGGIATSLGMVPGQVYIAEISHSSKRGSYSSISFIGLSFGILLIYCLGSVLQWRIVAGLSIIIPVVSALMLLYLPESPVWYIRNGNLDKARNACFWFRRNIREALEEVDELVKRVANENREREENPRSTLAMFLSPQVLKPLIIMNVLIMFQSLSGVYLFVFYAVEIISEIGNIEMNHFLVGVITAAVRVAFTIVATISLAFIGRRPIAITSALGAGISAMSLGTILYFSPNPNSYLLAGTLLSYISSSTVGLLILPGMMLGEIFPAKVRALSGSISFSMFSVFTFIITKMYPILKQTFKFYGMFWFFGTISFLAAVYVYIALPETKGKTLNDIEDYFLGNNFLWVTRKTSGTNQEQT